MAEFDGVHDSTKKRLVAWIELQKCLTPITIACQYITVLVSYLNVMHMSFPRGKKGGIRIEYQIL